MSKLAQQMEPLVPMTARARMQRYSQRLAACPEHDPHEHALRAIRGELWRRSLARRPIPSHRALTIYHSGGRPSPVRRGPNLKRFHPPGR